MKKQTLKRVNISVNLRYIVVALMGAMCFTLLTSMDGCDGATISNPMEPTIEDVPVWRLQVRTHTCDRNKAGTDSKVFVRFNNNPHDFYWLDLGGSDRDRDETNIYDVLLLDHNDEPLIRRLGDIQELSFGINGGDKWCFDRVEILVNNPFDRKTSRSQTEPFVIFDSDEGFEISTDQGFSKEVIIATHDELRGPLWNTNGIREQIQDFPIIPNLGALGFQREVMEEMLEGLLGNLMGPEKIASNLKWGNLEGRAFVGIKHKNNHDFNVARIDIDIAPSRLFDVEATIRIFCDEKEGAMNVEIIGTDLDGSRFLHLFTFGFTFAIENALEGAANQLLNVPVQLGERCINPNFTSDHHLRFN